MISPQTKLRIARPTNDLEAIVKQYMNGLGYSKIAAFEGHDGFDGVMLGHEEQVFHLEFTRHPGAEVIPKPHPDQLLVFYLADRTEWLSICSDMKKSGFVAVEPFNPYWREHGKTFEDLDGYRVVIQNQAWEK